VNAGAGKPDHTPSEAVNVSPCTADPDTAGGAVFAGASATTAVGEDPADEEPALFAPDTTTFTVEPTSELVST
jgi:hypothetical protein